LSKSLHSLADLKVWESFCVARMMRYIRSGRKISLLGKDSSAKSRNSLL
jgi:hypothetical protein